MPQLTYTTALRPAESSQSTDLAGRLHLADAERLQQAARGAGIHAVGVLVRARVSLVGQGQRQLLARGAEPACGAVERRERLVLDEAVDPAGVGQVAIVARIRDHDRLGR